MPRVHRFVFATILAFSAVSPSAASDGTWHRFPSVTRSQSAGIFDPVRRRVIVFGGTDLHGATLGDTWAMSVDDEHWTQIVTSGSGPAAREQHVAIYDPIGDRMIVYGGIDGATRRDDVWALSLADPPTWTELHPSGTSPGGLYAASAVLDAARQRILVFGGSTTSLRNTCWTLSLDAAPAWDSVTVSGARPSARYRHVAAYDPLHDAMVVVGGSFGDPRNDVLGDVWSLSLDGTPAWTAQLPTGTLPAARSSAAAVYEPSQRTLYLFGGVNASGPRNDVQRLWLGGGVPDWISLPTSGALPPRFGHVAVIDTTATLFWITGGDGGGQALSDAWRITPALPTWTEAIGSGRPPDRRFGHAMIYDPIRDRLIVYAGWDASRFYDDVWEFPLATDGPWKRLETFGPVPQARTFHTAVYDPMGDRMVVYGGYHGPALGDLWALSLGEHPAWSQILPTGPAPPARYWHTAVYDDVANRMTVFGGEDSGTMMNDAWELYLRPGFEQWSEIDSTGAPPARCCHEAAFDAVSAGVLIFGGADAVNVLGDLWRLEDSRHPLGPLWTLLLPSGAIGPRVDQASAFDWLRRRMIVHGGFANTSLADVWALSLDPSPAWNALAPSGLAPQARQEHPAVYDPVRDRLLIFGGWSGGSNVHDDLWSVDWGENAAAITACPGTTTFAAGDSVPLGFSFTAPAAPRLYSYSVVNERNWPSHETLSGTSGNVRIVNWAIFAPDSAAPGTNRVTLRVWATAAPLIADSCAVELREITTPVLASLVESAATSTEVRLAWRAAPLATFTLARRADGAAWREAARLRADAAGRVAYVDRDVRPGARYGYRLAIEGDATPIVETWIDVPRESFALHRARWADGALRLDLELERTTDARLVVFDAAGRRLLARAIPAGAQGARAIALPFDPPAGLYFVRVTQGAHEARARVLVLR